jgi:NAD(P)-dependent dehydrogenase (short-subunit alcohol dehydrogenase family)
VLDSTSSFAGTVHAHQLDLASRQSVEAFFQFVNAKIGDGQGIDALVNNAGIIRAGPDDWLTLEDYETVFRVNVCWMKFYVYFLLLRCSE